MHGVAGVVRVECSKGKINPYTHTHTERESEREGPMCGKEENPGHIL
jgi:hypothetical protein